MRHLHRLVLAAALFAPSAWAAEVPQASAPPPAGYVTLQYVASFACGVGGGALGGLGGAVVGVVVAVPMVMVTDLTLTDPLPWNLLGGATLVGAGTGIALGTSWCASVLRPPVGVRPPNPTGALVGAALGTVGLAGITTALILIPEPGIVAWEWGMFAGSQLPVLGAVVGSHVHPAGKARIGLAPRVDRRAPGLELRVGW